VVADAVITGQQTNANNAAADAVILMVDEAPVAFVANSTIRNREQKLKRQC